PVQAGAGVVLHAKPGDTVRAGQPLLTLHTDTPDRFDRAEDALAGSWSVGASAPDRTDPVLERVGG
ncbi:MAG: thymidine phosphorylase, partial [Nocardioidaceae bacterium]|nr:thymidine phosphorylase [Nocardioidaceae bacterium]